MKKVLKLISKVILLLILIVSTLTIVYSKTTASSNLKTISIINTDESGRELSGGEIQIVANDGTIIEQWISTPTPHKTLPLKEGIYKIKQVIAPEGYSVNNEEIEVTINKKGKATIYGEPMDIIKIININNGFYTSVKDKDLNTNLEGATLLIKNKNNTEVIKFTSKTNHQMIKGIPEGEYTLTEITPPNGYQPNEEVISFKVDIEGKIIDKDGFVISELVIYNKK